jgi:hypothetical protein
MCSFKIRHYLVVTLCILSPLFCAAQRAAGSSEGSYLSFEVPGALGTYPMSINNSMTVAGYYRTGSWTAAGFFRVAGGAITTFSVRGSAWTEPESINAAGDITGLYEVGNGVTNGDPHGFIRYADGRIVTFDASPAGPAGPQALPVSINNFGEVAGIYTYPNGYSAGFTRSRAGGFATLDYSTGATVLTGLNSSGALVGYCSGCDPNNIANSFLLHPDGYMVRFSVPVEGPSASEITLAESINDDGVIAGWYETCSSDCPTNTIGGFVRSPQGDITLFSPPGILLNPSPFGPFDQHGQYARVWSPKLLSINSEGAITGSYLDTKETEHGFVRNPYGTITSFDPPRGMQTAATSMNDSGVIAGFYYWSDLNAVGFLRIPAP